MNKTNNLISRHDERLKEWANSRETSIEIAQAIYVKAEGDSTIAQKIWEEPSVEDKDEIRTLAFKIQDIDFPDPDLQDICFYWGGEKVWREGY